MGKQITTTGNGQVVRNAPKNDLPTLLQKMGPELAKALPKHVSPDRISRIALTALRSNPELLKCSPGSFLGSVLSAAQLGLEVNTPLGHAYLVPYKGNCQLIVGYRGMMDLARRSGEVSNIYAHEVRKGDHFHVRLGLDQHIDHVPSDDPDREKQPITHVYAVAKMRDREPVFVVLTTSQVERYRARSSARNSPAWANDWEAMAKKTAVRRLATWLPQSAELARAAALDEAPELGQSQASMWDPSVTEALEAQGIDVDSLPAHDAQTGEHGAPEEPAPMREPGEDG